MEPIVSIIYVNYRTSALTLRSIESVQQKCVGVSYEIIVVDNCSGDDISQRLSGLSGVRLIETPDNLGFGRANNLGLESAKGKYVLFLNTDTELINDAISAMAAYLETHNDTGAVGANLYTATGEPNQSFLYCHTLRSEILGFMPNFLKRGQRRIHKWFNTTDKALPIKGYISGAAIMLRQEWLHTNGAFNPAFFMYYEDMELSVRVRRSGLKLVNIPWAKIIHIGGAASGSKSIDDAVKRYKMLNDAKFTYFNIVHSHFYAKMILLVNKFFHSIYSTFGNKKNRTLHKKLKDIL